MKKSKVLKSLTISIMATLLTAGSAYAETVPTISSQIGTNGKVQEVASEEKITAASTELGAENPIVPKVDLVNEIPAKENKIDTIVAPYVGRVVTKNIVTGNKFIKSEDVLDAIKTKPGMTISAAGINQDVQSIYETGWFYDITPSFRPVPEGVQVTYDVLENPKFESLEVKGNTKLSQEKINSIFKIEKGTLLNLRDVNAMVRNLEVEYNQEGYILARVMDVKMLPEGVLAIDVNEGIVEDFKVKGNVKTKDYVITREMRLKKGEPFNARDARRSMQRIYNLGYFEDVNVRLNPGQAPNSVDVEISVVEMSTGTFGIGAGYSDSDGFIGMVSVGEKNLRGTGDKINVRWEFGGADNRNYEFSYTKPWIDSKETSATINIYDITNEYADYDRNADEIARYDKKRRGQELTFSRKTNNEYISNYITLKNRDDIYKEAVSGYSPQYYESSYDSIAGNTAAERRAENFGKTRSIGFSRIYDSRDNIYDPHEGKRNSFSIEQASFGGDFKFTKFSTDYRYYFRQGTNNVIALQLGAGYATGTMPLSQRFALGGAETLRGYKDDQFKGNSMLKATVEYRVPIVEKVQGVVFVDSGYAWDKKLEKKFDLGLIKAGYGLGLRVNSPLGPIKLDYGRGSNGGRFHFSFGGQF